MKRKIIYSLIWLLLGVGGLVFFLISDCYHTLNRSWLFAIVTVYLVLYFVFILMIGEKKNEKKNS